MPIDTAERLTLHLEHAGDHIARIKCAKAFHRERATDFYSDGVTGFSFVLALMHAAFAHDLDYDDIRRTKGLVRRLRMKLIADLLFIVNTMRSKFSVRTAVFIFTIVTLFGWSVLWETIEDSNSQTGVDNTE